MSDGRHGLGRLVAGHIQEEGKGEKSTPFSTPSLWKSTPLLSTYRNTTDLSTQALSPSMTGAKGDGSQQTRLLGVSLVSFLTQTYLESTQTFSIGTRDCGYLCWSCRRISKQSQGRITLRRGLRRYHRTPVPRPTYR